MLDGVEAMSAEVAKPASKEDAWRERLLESLRDCGVQRATGSRWGRWAVAIAIAFLIGLITVAGRMFLNSLDLRTEGDRIVGTVLSVLWMLFAVFVLIRVRNRFIRQAWRYVARTAEEELSRPNCRRPILYLRSFRLDERIGRTSWFEFLFGSIPLANAEQQLTRTLRERGPVVAIGRPSEKLPPLGAARFYVSDELWRQKVVDVAEESQLILMATGSTDGLRWEVGHVVASVPPERLVLWLHPHLMRIGPQARQREWQLFLDRLGELFPRPLPSEIGEARFIYFTSDWEPIAVAPPRQLIPWGSPAANAMRLVLKAKDGQLDPATVAYRGPTPDESFVGVVGSRPLDGLRIAGLFVGAIALHIPSLVHGSLAQPLVFACTLTASVFLAYRYVREFWASVLVSLACTAAWLGPRATAWMVANDEHYDRLMSELADGSPVAAVACLFFGFVPSFAMLTALNWTIPRIWPRYFAIWLGAFAFYLPVPVLNHFMGEGAGLAGIFDWPKLLGELLFAGCVTLAVLLTTARKPRRESHREVAPAS